MHEFKPAWWAPEAHTQTLLAHFFRPVKKVLTKRYRLETPDGDFVDYDFLEGDKEAPIVLILHGLEGSSKSRYVQSLLSHLDDKKWNAIALNHRGCSGVPNRLDRTYHSGMTDDIELVLKHLSAQGYSLIYAVGYSIGGNMLLKYLGETNQGKEHLIARAAVVSVPYDLASSVQLLENSMITRWIYTRSMLKSLKKKVCEKFRSHPLKINLRRILRCDTFSVFDEEVTARLNGFRSAQAYWENSSSMNYLYCVRIPVLMIHSADDPFLTKKYIPMDWIAENKFLALLLTEKGGHMGFLMGKSPWRQKPWLEEAIFKYFNNVP